MINFKKAVIFAALIAASAWAQFAGGNGTAANPFIISTPEHLRAVDNHLTAHFRLANDIDLNGSEENQWTPLGGFLGTFDGNGNAIRGLYINNLNVNFNNNRQGLFSELSGGTVRNLGVYVNITVRSSTVICYVGGIAGVLSPGTIENSYAVGNIDNVESASIVGGLAGEVWQGIIINSNANVNLKGGGGLAGAVQNNSRIENSYALGNIEGGGGGLVGVLGNGCIIKNSFATGNSTRIMERWGTTYSGLVGINNGTIKNSYASGTGVRRIMINWQPQEETEETNFFAGIGGGTICENSGMRTTAQMKQRATFIGWDFDFIWSIYEDVSFPYLDIREIHTPSSVVYTGAEIKISVKYGSSALNTIIELTEGIDFTAIYSNNINVGTASVEITGIGDYELIALYRGNLL